MLALLVLAGAATTLGEAIRAGIDPCRAASASDEILVCRRRGAGERYRVPAPFRDPGFDPGATVDSVMRERHRLIDGDGSSPDGSRGSCSPVGQNGWTGCMLKAMRERRDQDAR